MTMISVIIAAALAAIVAVLVVVTVKKRNSTGKTPVFAVVLAILFAGLLVIVPPSIHIVETGEVAVVKHLGEAKDVKHPGMHFDLWLTTEYEYYDTKVQNLELMASTYSDDSQTMDIAVTLQYQIDAGKAVEIARQHGSLASLQNKIAAIVTEKTKAVLSSYTAMEIIAERSSMSPKVEQAITEAIGDKYFVTISTVLLTNIDFSDAFEKAVEDKMIAEQKQLQAEYENQMNIAKAEAEAAAAIKKAEAEAEAKLIAAEAERDSQVELARAEALAIQLKSVEIARTLGFSVEEIVNTDENGETTIEYRIDFEGKSEQEIALITDYLKYMEYLAKWDGKLPTVVSGDGASVYIPVDPAQ